MTQSQRKLLKETLTSFTTLKDVDISLAEQSDITVSFTTTFGDSAYDLEFNESDSGYEIILLTSSETPLMRDSIEEFNQSEIDSLLDHVIETIRELEGN